MDRRERRPVVARYRAEVSVDVDIAESSSGQLVVVTSRTRSRFAVVGSAFLSGEVGDHRR